MAVMFFARPLRVALASFVAAAVCACSSAESGDQAGAGTSGGGSAALAGSSGVANAAGGAAGNVSSTMGGTLPVESSGGASGGSLTTGGGGASQATGGTTASGGSGGRAGIGGRGAFAGMSGDGGTMGGREGGGRANGGGANGGSAGMMALAGNGGISAGGGSAGHAGASAGAAGADDGACPYTGHVTYNLQKAANPSATQQKAYDLISTAMERAIGYYNCYTNITKSLNVSYEPSVETADGNINGSIRFGSDTTYMDYRTAMHEIAHTAGIGQASNWSSFISNGLFTGTNANQQLQAINATLTKPVETELHADSQHFWPYGINQQSEVKSEADLVFHCEMVMAIRKDLGL